MDLFRVLHLLLCLCFSGICTAVDVTLSSTGPVLLDTPITFTAKIESYQGGTYVYKWKDDTHQEFEDDNQGPFSNWTILYTSDEDEKYVGRRTVTVRIYYDTVIYVPIAFAKKSISFDLTVVLNGNLSVTQENVTTTDPHFVSTLNATNITTVLHDPNGWIRKHTERITFYFQIINRETKKFIMIGPCLTPSVIFNISKPANYIIQCNVVLLLSDVPITTSTTSTTTTSTSTTSTTTKSPTTTTASTPTKITTNPNSKRIKERTPLTLSPNFFSSALVQGSPNPGGMDSNGVPDSSLNYFPASYTQSYRCDGWWDQSDNVHSTLSPEVLERITDKYGNFIYYISAREPIGKFNISGSTWLKHGHMLNLNITCTGSGPFNYCFNITHGAYNESDEMHCGNYNSKSNECYFKIHHYLRHTGTYTVVIGVYNEVSRILDRTAINVYIVNRKPQLSYIIIPISCSLVAIIIVVFGIAHFIQSTNRYSIEVADFDFCASEDNEYKNFYQQLKESFYRSCSSEIDNSDSGWRPPRSHIERPRILEDEHSNEEG